MSSQVFSISPSQEFGGDDGSWSTFAIQVGTPPNSKTLFVLPGTSVRSTWVVHPLACSQSAISNCTDARGNVFDPDTSTSWRNATSSSAAGGGYYYLPFTAEEALNPLLPGLQYNSSSIPGVDTIAFGFQGNDAPTLKIAPIAAYVANVPWLGVIGLSPYGESIDLSSQAIPSILDQFNSTHQTSLYWGYTAGAWYRGDNVRNLGSLTFGGYDASRGNVDDVLTVPMPISDTYHALQVTVRGITLSQGTNNQTIEQPPIVVQMDSLVPEMWLPEAVYSVLESSLGLIWNDTINLYVVNDTQHDDLTARQVSMTFTLAANSTSGDTVQIKLPYTSLQPVAQYPVSADPQGTLRYFPVRRAQSQDQFFLGRTFLQEAYLAVDYEANNLYVSPATFPSATTPENLTAVVSGKDVVATPAHSPSKSNALSGGTIAGIVIGAIAALALAVLAGVLIWRFCGKKKSNRNRKSEGATSLGGTTIEAWNEDVPTGQAEHFKHVFEASGEDSDHFNSELDATVTARGVITRSELSAGTVRRTSEQSQVPTSPMHRHELSAGTIRRTSEQSRASVSPLDERSRRRQTRDSYGVPSPQAVDFPSPPLGHFGTPSPQLSDTPHNQPSPPMSEARGWLSGPVPMYHELHGRSRDGPASPSSPAPELQPELTVNQAALERLERLERADDETT